MRSGVVGAFLAIVVACCRLAWAQPAPSVQEMVDQLQAPRTRSLRNLVVEESERTKPPSISLLIQFDFDSAKIRNGSLPVLLDLSKALQSTELKEARFAIEGHTDAKGRSEYNQRLSERRAGSVRDLLVRQGVDVSRLVAVGKGSSELVRADDPLAPENRRVRIVNLD